MAAYRDNDVARVGEVRARLHDGDVAGAATAAVEFWLARNERGDYLDEAHVEVWRELERGGALRPAIAAGLAAIQAGQLLRPAAFIALSERFTSDADDVPAALSPAEATALLAIADIALANDWPADPYLAAVFVRLVEGKQEAMLWAYIQARREALAATTPRWTLVGFVLTTSRVGNRRDVDAWFADWPARADVPMWLIAAYAATIIQQADNLAKLPAPAQRKVFALARHALDAAVADDSAPFLLALVLIGHLDAGDDQAFLDDVARTGVALAAGARQAPLHHPLVRYANGVKRSHRVEDADFAWEDMRADVGAMVFVPIVGYATLIAETRRRRPVNFRIVQLMAEQRGLTRATARIARVLVEMAAIPRGDPRAIALFREMEKARPATFPWMRPMWKRLVRTRIRWSTRVRLSL